MFADRWLTVFCVHELHFQMENTKKVEEEATSDTCIDLVNIMRELDSLSSALDRLARMFDSLT